MLPIVDVYREYYGDRMMWFNFGTFYVAMAGAALVVELLFMSLGLVPSARRQQSRWVPPRVPSVRTIRANHSEVIGSWIAGVGLEPTTPAL